MLSLSIHASSLENADRYNRVARMDIVYEKLSPVADYKLVLIERNRDVPPPRTLKAYPRWSASLWDLAARSIAISLPEEAPNIEQVPEVVPGGNRCAFARTLSVVINHTAGDVRNTLGSLSIEQVGRRRGVYQALFDEHTMKSSRTAPFKFAPAFFRPAELVLHACVHRLNDNAELPPRPGLCAPPPLEVDGLPYIAIHQLVEPAKTGFQTWLSWFSEAAVEYPGAPLGIAPETLYTKFLCSAI